MDAVKLFHFKIAHFLLIIVYTYYVVANGSPGRGNSFQAATELFKYDFTKNGKTYPASSLKITFVINNADTAATDMIALQMKTRHFHNFTVVTERQNLKMRISELVK